MAKENNLKDQLFELEPLSPERQERFRNELAQIVDPRLSRSHRFYYIGGLVCVLIGIPGTVCGVLLDAEYRWIWGLNLIISTVFAGWIFYLLKRGSEPLATMQGLSKGMSAIVFGLAVLSIVIGFQTPSLESILWSIGALLVFILTSFINLWNGMLASERTLREHILRVEYRLAVRDDSPQ